MIPPAYRPNDESKKEDGALAEVNHARALPRRLRDRLSTRTGLLSKGRIFVQNILFQISYDPSIERQSAPHREHLPRCPTWLNLQIGSIVMVNLPGKNLLNQIVRRGVRAVVPARRHTTAAATSNAPAQALATAGSLSPLVRRTSLSGTPRPRSTSPRQDHGVPSLPQLGFLANPAASLRPAWMHADDHNSPAPSSSRPSIADAARHVFAQPHAPELPRFDFQQRPAMTLGQELMADHIALDHEIPDHATSIASDAGTIGSRRASSPGNSSRLFESHRSGSLESLPTSVESSSSGSLEIFPPGVPGFGGVQVVLNPNFLDGDSDSHSSGSSHSGLPEHVPGQTGFGGPQVVLSRASDDGVSVESRRTGSLEGSPGETGFGGVRVGLPRELDGRSIESRRTSSLENLPGGSRWGAPHGRVSRDSDDGSVESRRTGSLGSMANGSLESLHGETGFGGPRVTLGRDEDQRSPGMDLRFRPASEGGSLESRRTESSEDFVPGETGFGGPRVTLDRDEDQRSPGMDLRFRPASDGRSVESRRTESSEDFVPGQTGFGGPRVTLGRDEEHSPIHSRHARTPSPSLPSMPRTGQIVPAPPVERNILGRTPAQEIVVEAAARRDGTPQDLPLVPSNGTSVEGTPREVQPTLPHQNYVPFPSTSAPRLQTRELPDVDAA